MKKKILLLTIMSILIIALFIPNSSNATNYDIKWEKNYQTENSESFRDAVETSDGGVVAVGYVSSIPVTAYRRTDAVIVKYSKTGEVEWQQVLEGTSDEEFRTVTATTDGGFVAVGFSYSSELCTKGGIDSIIVKYSSNGKKLWQKIYGGTQTDMLEDVAATSDGGFVAVGTSNSPELNNDIGAYYNSIIVKFDSNGEEQWQQTMGEEKENEFNSVIETKQGDFIAVGCLEESNFAEPLIVKYDKTGQKVWQNEYENEEFVGQRLASVIETSSGELIIVGRKDNNLDMATNAIISKYSTDGEKNWEKEFGEGTGITYFNSVTETSNGGFVAVGQSNEELIVNSRETDGIIVKYDKDGNLEWQKNYGQPEDREQFVAVVETTNNEIVAVGDVFWYSKSTLFDGIIVNYKEVLKTIEVTNVIEPLDGEATVYDGITVPEDANYEIDTVAWFVSDTEDDYDYERMGENERFEAGKYYKLQLEFVTKNDYEFSSPIEATINGKEAVAMTTYTDAQAFATIEFGKLAEAKEYNFIEGANQTYTIGKSESATFKIDGEFDKFLNVKIDGKEISDFTAKSGSTVITLSKSYLESLTVGEHTIIATFTDGRATTKFTIAKEEATNPGTDQTGSTNPTTPPEGSESTPPGGSGTATPEDTGSTPPESSGENKDNSNNPKTGDNILLFVGILTISVIGIWATTKFKKVVKNK